MAGRPGLRPLDRFSSWAIKTEEKMMRKSTLWILPFAAALAVVTTTGGRSHAGVIGGPLGLHEAADELGLTETVQFFWGGHRYCWYYNGWRGPGWYRCGFHLRRGFGWGGPAGWHGWGRPGRPVARPPVVRPRPPVARPPVVRPRPPVARPPRPGRPVARPPTSGRPGVQRPQARPNRVR